MNIQQLIINEVLQHGHWGVLRNGDIIGPKAWAAMADLVGMSSKGASHFRYVYFADGTKELNSKAILGLSMFFGFDREAIVKVNQELNK